MKIIPRTVILLFAWCLGCAAFAFDEPTTLSEAIDMLDDYVGRKGKFLSARLAVIDSLKHSVGETGHAANAEAYMRLGDNYHLLNTDSALFYYGKAYEVAERSGDRDVATALKLRIAPLLPVNAIVREGVELYEGIDPDDLPTWMRRNYYEAGNRLYLYTMSFYSVDSLREKYRRLAAVATDSLLQYLERGTPAYRFYSAQAAHNRGDLAMAHAGMRKVMEMVDVSDNLYARAAAELAGIISERANHNRDERLYYLIMAAVGDVAAGTRETTALQDVGMSLYESGDLTRAYRYLSMSQDDAIHSGARMRTLQVAESLPIISRAYSDVTRRDRTRLRVTVGLLALAAVVLAVFVVLILRQRKHMHRYEERMRESLIAKDDYIGRILSLCSNYIERLEDFNRMAGRKIKAGQVSELYDMIESGKMLQEQTHKFHELFDAAFAKVYPDFVVKVNELLMPEKQIVPPADGRLTPELRMLAFMKLGITDSPQLARFLGLSLNTVYAYRNKLKNRAKNRDDFEKMLAEIGRISY